jgi:hypothetical protein
MAKTNIPGITTFLLSIFSLMLFSLEHSVEHSSFDFTSDMPPKQNKVSFPFYSKYPMIDLFIDSDRLDFLKFFPCLYPVRQSTKKTTFLRVKMCTFNALKKFFFRKKKQISESLCFQIGFYSKKIFF